jgi:hypothetical protein
MPKGSDSFITLRPDEQFANAAWRWKQALSATTNDIVHPKVYRPSGALSWGYLRATRCSPRNVLTLRSSWGGKRVATCGPPNRFFL